MIQLTQVTQKLVKIISLYGLKRKTRYFSHTWKKSSPRLFSKLFPRSRAKTILTLECIAKAWASSATAGKESARTVSLSSTLGRFTHSGFGSRSKMCLNRDKLKVSFQKTCLTSTISPMKDISMTPKVMTFWLSIQSCLETLPPDCLIAATPTVRRLPRSNRTSRCIQSACLRRRISSTGQNSALTTVRSLRAKKNTELPLAYVAQPSARVGSLILQSPKRTKASRKSTTRSSTETWSFTMQLQHAALVGKYRFFLFWLLSLSFREGITTED